ncbi:hypothetical protein [Streptomyces sp. NPDC007083]|uniref:hypothetical protein n=1 Tax=Streptomyces sp. NPDC007083 TaxID=3156913 RepID=UPI0033D4EB78
MARHAPNHRLNALLMESGWTAAALAREVNAIGDAQGWQLSYTRSSVAHWLRGSRPRAPVPELVAVAFSRQLGRPVTAEDTGLRQLTSDQASLSLTTAAGRTPSDRLLLLIRGDTDPARRVQLRQLPYSPPQDTEVRWPTQAPPLQTPSMGGSRSTAMSCGVGALPATIRGVAHLIEEHGGAHARTAVAAYLADDVCPLLIHRAPRQLRRELFVRTAQLTYLLGVMTDDAGHYELAKRYYTAAVGLARQAGHRPAFAITLRAMSLQALRLGHPREAHDLATCAVDAAGRNASGAVRSFVLIQRARTAALDGQPRLALRLMETAVRQHDRSAGCSSDPFTSYPRAGLDYQRAAVFSVLGRYGDAVAALEASTVHRDPRERAPAALTYARLAETHLRLGHLDAACAQWQHFLDLYPYLRSRRAEQALVGLRRSLRPYGRAPWARTVLGRARALGPGPGGG